MKIRNRLTLWFTLLVGFLTLLSSIVILIAVRGYTYDQRTKEAFDKVEEVEKLIYSLEKDSIGENLTFNFEDPELLSKNITDQGTKVYEGFYLQVENIKGIIFPVHLTLAVKNYL